MNVQVKKAVTRIINTQVKVRGSHAGSLKYALQTQLPSYFTDDMFNKALVIFNIKKYANI